MGRVNNRMLTLDEYLRPIKVRVESAHIRRALNQTNWHRKNAAKILGISYRGLLYKIKLYKLDDVLEGEE